jgi:hypothetical protein
VTVTTEDASFPKYRLYDRDIGKLSKGTAFANPFQIVIDQGPVISYPVSRIIIPVGHNFNGLACSVYYSTDNFVVDSHVAASWSQADALLIDKSFTVMTKRYWAFWIAAPATIVELSEVFLGQAYTFAVNPVYGARQGRKRNVQSDESTAGYSRSVKRGELRRVRTYEMQNMEQAQETEFEAWETLCEGIKPFYIEDHLGNVIFMEKLDEEDYGYDSEDGATVYYSGRLSLREVLGR